MSVLALAVTAAESHRNPALAELDDEDRRLYARIPATIKYVDHPCFHEAGVEQELFGPGARVVRVPRWRYFPALPEDDWREPRTRIDLSPDEQTHLFLRYNYARFRLSRLLDGRRNSPGRQPPAERIVRWYRRVLGCRADLVEGNMALVVAMAKRTRILNVDFEDLISEGSLALMRSIETFDLTRGYRLSTYACRAILKSFHRLATRTSRHRRRFDSQFDPDLERSDYDERRHEMQRNDRVDDLRDVLARNRAKLTETELVVVMRRFAIGMAGGTLRDVGRTVGLTAERVRQIQHLALRKLRRVLGSM